MKIVFMGTPEIAVPSLEGLIGSGHEVIAVITQPDRISGRGMNVHYSPVKETAIRHGIPCYQPESVSDPEVLDSLESLGADVFAVAAYAQKLPDRLLSMARFGCINMHPSLLPRYRGSGPLRGPILNGDERTGVTIMQVVQKWDAGDILLQESFAMEPKETSATLEKKCAQLGARLMVQTVNGLEAGTITPVPQDEDQATYIKQISKDAGLIDFQQSAVYIERLIRSCDPWPSAFTALDGKTFKIWEADTAMELPDEAPRNTAGQAPCGSVAYADKRSIYIRTGAGYLIPRSVQIEGKKRMSMEDFLKGRKIGQGTCFG